MQNKPAFYFSLGRENFLARQGVEKEGSAEESVDEVDGLVLLAFCHNFYFSLVTSHIKS